MSGLYMSIAERGDVSVLRLYGPLNAATAGDLHAMLTPFRGRSVLLDLTECPSLDLDGLLALAAFYDHTREAGGAMHLDPVPPPLARYLLEHHMGYLLAPASPGAPEPSK